MPGRSRRSGPRRAAASRSRSLAPPRDGCGQSLPSLLAPLRLLFRPFPGNLLFVGPNPRAATAIEAGLRIAFVAVLLAAAVVVAVRFRAASPPGRRAMLPSVAGALCLLVLVALLLRDAVQGPRFTEAGVLDWAVALSIVLVPLAFLAGLLRSRLARGGLADLFRTLPTLQPAQLQSVLGHWHMALQASKHGRAVALARLEEVRASFAAAGAV